MPLRSMFSSVVATLRRFGYSPVADRAARHCVADDQRDKLTAGGNLVTPERAGLQKLKRMDWIILSKATVAYCPSLSGATNTR